MIICIMNKKKMYGVYDRYANARDSPDEYNSAAGFENVLPSVVLYLTRRTSSQRDAREVQKTGEQNASAILLPSGSGNRFSPLHAKTHSLSSTLRARVIYKCIYICIISNDSREYLRCVFVKQKIKK